MNVDHSIITKLFEKEINSPLRKEREKQNPSNSVIVNFFYAKKPFKKDHM